MIIEQLSFQIVSLLSVDISAYIYSRIILNLEANLKKAILLAWGGKIYIYLRPKMVNKQRVCPIEGERVRPQA